MSSELSSGVSGGSAPSQSARQTPRAKVDAGVCVFSAGARRFALDTSLVGEVTNVVGLLAVPQSAPALLGIFSLRGTPVAVVDLLALLGQPSAAVGAEVQVLVLRTAEGVLAGLRIDRLHAVVPAASGRRLATTTSEHRVIVGLFEREGDETSLFLSSELLVEQLTSLGFSNQNKTEAQASKRLA
jgi:chemotaxis signal transduction protein